MVNKEPFHNHFAQENSLRLSGDAACAPVRRFVPYLEHCRINRARLPALALPAPRFALSPWADSGCYPVGIALASFSSCAAFSNRARRGKLW